MLTLLARNSEHESRAYLVARKSPLKRVANVGDWPGAFHRPLAAPDIYGLIEAGREDKAAYW